MSLSSFSRIENAPHGPYFLACVRCGGTSTSGIDGKLVNVLGRQRRFRGIDYVEHHLACFGRAVPRPLVERRYGESVHRVH